MLRVQTEQCQLQKLTSSSQLVVVLGDVTNATFSDLILDDAACHENLMLMNNILGNPGGRAQVTNRGYMQGGLEKI